MFSFPQPPCRDGGEERIEGCPVIELQDKPQDVLDILRAIYHPSHFDQLSPTADLDILLNFIGGILRLSTKYLVHELRRRCISLLSARFPASYKGYMLLGPRPYSPSSSSTGAYTGSGSAIQDDTSMNWSSITTFTLTPTTNQTPTDGHGSTTTTFSIQPHPSSHQRQSRSRRHSDHIVSRDREHYRLKALKGGDDQPPKPKPSSIMRAIALANETHALTILPYAYYLLARTSEPQRLLAHTSGSLSWHQKAITLVGRTFLERAETSISHAFLTSFVVAPACLTPSTCANARGPLVEWALMCTKGRGGPEPLRPWDRWERLGVCHACVAHAMERHESDREKVWDSLPGYFELGTWTRLKDLQQL
ncbi:hypothetical protein H0H92_010844 [Tricholoma furcatifolium]|nr:hypothetical protein H0H92_010844 [Tricholoma furcatifolium]